MPQRKQTLYEILGVASDALPLDLGLAYEKRLARLQRTGARDPSEAALLREAHEVLSNPKRREAYDASLLAESERAAARERAHAPDLVLEAEEGAPQRVRIPPVGIAAGLVALLVIALSALHSPAPEAPPAPPPPVAAAPPQPPPQPMAPKEILALARKSVGRVLAIEMSGRAVPLGLAIAVEPRAMVTTCHGIPAGSQLVVALGPDDRSATLLIADESLDLCRLSVDPPLVPVALAARDPKPGDTIYAMGANAQGALVLTQGEVKSMIPDSRGPMIELGMPVAPEGGGPVFDAYGRLAGIATPGRAHGAGASLAIPASSFASMRSRENAPARAGASAGRTAAQLASSTSATTTHTANTSAKTVSSEGGQRIALSGQGRRKYGASISHGMRLGWSFGTER